MTSLVLRLTSWSKRYPIVRGMVLYGVLWPSSSLCQQAIVGTHKFDMAQASRYGVFGCFVVAPSLHVWLKISNFWFPQMNLKTALVKMVIDQSTFGPLMLACFLGGMSLFEGGSIGDAMQELRLKFFNTLKVALCVWPAVQTINFMFVPMHYRMLYIGTCSFLWTVFLAIVKQSKVQVMEGPANIVGPHAGATSE